MRQVSTPAHTLDCFSLAARIDSLPVLAARLDALAAEHALETHLTWRLHIVLEELVVNALQHGHCPRDSSLQIRIQRARECLIIRYRDTGRHFDISVPPPPMEKPPTSCT